MEHIGGFNVMAVVFMDGFDVYSGLTAPLGVGAKYGGTLSAQTLVAGRFGDLAFRHAQSTNSFITSPAFTSVSSFTFGCSYKQDTFTNNTRAISFYSGATEQCGFVVNTDGSISAHRAGTVLGTSAAGLFALSFWYTLEVEVVISDTVGRITIYQDGVSILNVTGADTRNGAPTDVTVLRVGPAASTSAIVLDDIYITDSATKPTAALRIKTLVPNADGATLNFTLSAGTNHYAVVDELPWSSTDYAQGSTVGDLDELGITALPATPTAIQAVQVAGCLQKTDATARSMALEVKSGATTSTGSNYSLSTTGGRHDRIIDLDPDTAAAWTNSAITALKLRPKITV